jgi:uncharacterized repeat protein (TIGR01451 family)
MISTGKESERERRDWMIVLVILLFGFLCVLLAGEWAVRFSPTWKLDANMRSNLDPDSRFLTDKPIGFFEPLDPSILTQPVWINVFLTPGAVFETKPPAALTALTNPPGSTNTPLPTRSATPTALNPTNTPLAVIPTATNTFSFSPSFTPTRTPIPPATATSPVPSADLLITKADGLTFVNTGEVVVYTVRVTNNGPAGVLGAILSDPPVAGLSKTAVACSPTPGECVTAPTIAQLESGTFALPTLNGGQFYEITVTTSVTATSGSVSNTASIGAPSGIHDPNPTDNAATDTNLISVSADLQITKTDNSTDYVANALKTYEITVYNAGPSDVTGASVTDVFSTNANIFPSVIWSCSSNNGGSCAPANGIGDINNTVDLPSGSSVTYTALAVVVSNPSLSLVNTATVTAPLGVNDPNPLNNSAVDSDTLIVPDPPPPQVGTAPDNTIYILPAGGTLTLDLAVTANGDLGIPDIVIYEFDNAGMVFMDWMIIQVGDGSNWYTVFYWGDDLADTNSNMNINILPPNTPPEEDNRMLATAVYFYNGPGITIDIDPMVSMGTYPYLRIIAPNGDADGQLEIDAIELLP